MYLRTYASSADSDLMYDAGAGAGFLSAFNIVGDPNDVVLPLSFDFSISGTLSATSAAGNEDSVASAGIQYDVQTSADRFLGGATLTSQAGIPTGATSGNLVGDVSLTGFTGITYTFDSTFSLPVTLSGTEVDALSATLSSVASSTPGASAYSDFSDTLDLTSITLPSGFTQVNPSDLQVVFDSGLTMPVTTAVPEPASMFMAATGLFCVAIGRKSWVRPFRRS
jgi:hypothetical protein